MHLKIQKCHYLLPAEFRGWVLTEALSKGFLNYFKGTWRKEEHLPKRRVVGKVERLRGLKALKGYRVWSEHRGQGKTNLEKEVTISHHKMTSK